MSDRLCKGYRPIGSCIAMSEKFNYPDMTILVMVAEILGGF